MLMDFTVSVDVEVGFVTIVMRGLDKILGGIVMMMTSLWKEMSIIGVIDSSNRTMAISNFLVLLTILSNLLNINEVS